MGIRKSTLMGWRSACGGSPWANSIAVIPRDQISACGRRWVGVLYRYPSYPVANIHSKYPGLLISQSFFGNKTKKHGNNSDDSIKL